MKPVYLQHLTCQKSTTGSFYCWIPEQLWLVADSSMNPGGFPGGSLGKVSACNVGDLALIPGLGGSPGEGNGNPTPILLPGKFDGQRSLVSCSPWNSKDSKESNTTEQIHFSWSRWLATSCCEVFWWCFYPQLGKAGFALHIHWAVSTAH